jgi:hypothetical protein
LAWDILHVYTFEFSVSLTDGMLSCRSLCCCYVKSSSSSLCVAAFFSLLWYWLIFVFFLGFIH